ncbi:hypothetical protein P3S68_007373 [Capsicum galapagoense]
MLMDAAYITVDSFHDLGFDKDVVVEKIEGKADSGDAVIHKLRSAKSEQLYLKYAHDILDGVSLLGEIWTHKLSRLVLVSFLNSYISNMLMTYLTRFHFLERFEPINLAACFQHILEKIRYLL